MTDEEFDKKYDRAFLMSFIYIIGLGIVMVGSLGLGIYFLVKSLG